MISGGGPDARRAYELRSSTARSQATRKVGEYYASVHRLDRDLHSCAAATGAAPRCPIALPVANRPGVCASSKPGNLCLGHETKQKCHNPLGTYSREKNIW